jgi:hypothetical protein
MVIVNSNLNNFSEIPTFLNIFGGFSNEYEYTEDQIFRKKIHHDVLTVGIT